MLSKLPRLSLILISTLYWAFFVLSSMVLVMGSACIWLVTYPFDPNRKVLQQYSCFWASLYLWVNPFWLLKKAGLKNADPKQTYVIVANHQSMADIICVFNTFLHFKWVAKKSLFKAPLLGWNMSLNGYVSIDRGNPNSRQECMTQCRDWLNKGSSILFFPEGTRSKNGTLQAFKPGAFRLALETGRDILPIVIKGSLHALPKHSFVMNGISKMHLEILPPVSIAHYKNMGLEEGAEKLSQAVRAKIVEKLS